MNTKFDRRGTLLAALALGAHALAAPAAAQQLFPTAETAARSFVEAIATNDDEAVARVLGADYRKFIPKGAPEDKTRFLEAWAAGNKVVTQGDKAMLEVGRHGWTLPLPIVKTGAGWKFDPRAGAEEMRIRRIGRNEYAAMQVSLAFVDAQREYAQRDWDGDGVKSFAMRGLSSPGKRDGLYWASLPGEPEAPLGAQFADAKPAQPFYGYLYRILKAQGTGAPGGAKSFVKNGRMTEGFALIATPAKWGDTGVMSFIVSHDGVVWEKDLGPDTAAVAAGIMSFDPTGWQKADVPKP